MQNNHGKSQQDFKVKVKELRKSFEKDIEQQIHTFLKMTNQKWDQLQLNDPHILYFSKHIPKYDAIRTMKYLNQSFLCTEKNWVFHAQPETQLNEDGKEILTGLYSIITTY